MQTTSTSPRKVRVHLLSESDIHKGGYDSPNGRTHCLQGWRRKFFGLLGDSPLAQRVNDLLAQECGGDIADANDKGKSPHNVWNFVMQTIPEVVIVSPVDIPSIP